MQSGKNTSKLPVILLLALSLGSLFILPWGNTREYMATADFLNSLSAEERAEIGDLAVESLSPQKKFSAMVGEIVVHVLGAGIPLVILVIILRKRQTRDQD